MIDDVATLFKLAGNQGRPDDWNDHFDPIGLILQIPPKREDYWCTPLNALTFARTGGDGTHYSLASVSTSRRSDQVVHPSETRGPRNAEDHALKATTYGTRSHRPPHKNSLRIKSLLQAVGHGVPRRRVH